MKHLLLASVLFMLTLTSASVADNMRPKSELETVIIVYKTHFDIGYTAMARDVLHEYRTEMADRVLDAIEVNSRQQKEQQFGINFYLISRILSGRKNHFGFGILYFPIAL